MRTFTAGLLVWLVLLAAWFFFVFQFSSSELMAGVTASSITLFAIQRSLRAAPLQAKVSLSWLIAVCEIPGATVQGMAMLFQSCGRYLKGLPSQSIWQVIHFRPSGDEDEQRGRRALATLLTTITPSSYVVDVEAEHEFMLIHSLENAPVPKMVRDLEASQVKSS